MLGQRLGSSSLLFGKVIAVYGDNNKMEYIKVHRFLSAKCRFFKI